MCSAYEVEDAGRRDEVCDLPQGSHGVVHKVEHLDEAEQAGVVGRNDGEGAESALAHDEQGIGADLGWRQRDWVPGHDGGDWGTVQRHSARDALGSREFVMPDSLLESTVRMAAALERARESAVAQERTVAVSENVRGREAHDDVAEGADRHDGAEGRRGRRRRLGKR